MISAVTGLGRAGWVEFYATPKAIGGDEMVSWYKRLIAAIAAIFLLLGTGTVAHAASGEKAVLIPGAMPFKLINPFYPLNKYFLYPNIGINFRGDDDSKVIDYSQNPLASNWAIRQGVKRAMAAVREIDGKVVVIGESMGSMVAARVAVELANSSHPPSVDNIRFVLMAPPEAGAAEYFKVGAYIPILNYRVSRVPESPYPTTLVIGEYDGWSDPPDRPWNLVSLLNSVLGALFFVHGQTSLIDPADVPPENITVERNSKGGTVTTYFVPTEHLPLTQVLRLVVPAALVDILDSVLRPIVDAGYHRHDQPGDSRPYLSDGEIHWNCQGQQNKADVSDGVAADAGPAKADLSDGVAADAGPTKADVSDGVAADRGPTEADLSGGVAADTGVTKADLSDGIAEDPGQVPADLNGGTAEDAAKVEADLNDGAAEDPGQTKADLNDGAVADADQSEQRAATDGEGQEIKADLNEGVAADAA